MSSSCFPQGHALIVGVGSYVHVPSLNVPTTVADAEAVASIVQDPQFCGYPTEQVTVLTNEQATREGILAALDRLTQVSKEDTVFFFYSGHGEDDTSGNYNLTTYDTQLSDSRKVMPGSAVSQAEWIARLKAIPAERVLLIVNACHAGHLSPTLSAEETATGRPLPSQAANAVLATGSGRVIITACRENQFSFVGPGERTLFAQSLVDGLRGQGDVSNRGGFISVFDLYMHLYYAVDDSVKRHVPESTRKRYGGKQEPELTVQKGVGPFPVALYRGATTLGSFPAEQDLDTSMPIRQIEPARSQRALNQIIGTATVRGDNLGQNVGVSYDSMTQHQQTIHNEASNQGAQGTLHGPVSFDQRGQQVQNRQYSAGRDFIQSGGNVIRADRDYVAGDKVSGDIRVGGNVSGGNVVVGHNNQVQTQTQSGGGSQDTLAQAFVQIHQAINARPHDPNVDKDEIITLIQSIEQEALKAQQANHNKLTRWLRHLADMAPEIHERTSAALKHHGVLS